MNGNGSFTYTPNANYSGADSFSYRAYDGTALSNIATASITVNPVVNNPPVANNDTATTNEDNAVTIAVLANDTDADGNPLTAALVTGPANGTLVLNPNNTFTYMPNANFNGTDSFTYRANDGTANSNNATVTITVNPVNDAPVAVNDAFTTNANTALTITAPGVLGNDTDVDGDTLSVGVISTGPAHGSLSLNGNGSFTYTPNANYTGADSFSYRAYDGTTLSNIATVNLTVNPTVNNPPVANNDTATTNEDAGVTIAVLANDTDADGNPLTAVLVTGPANGTLVLNPNNTFTYTPNANFNGTDSFTYVANDGVANSNTATVNITINPVNDAPVAVNDSFNASKNVPLTITAPGVLGNDTDVDGDTLSVGVIATGPAHGSLSLNGDGSFTYTPTANYTGADSFSYRAYDGTALSNIATVNIAVNNNPPVANNDTATTNEDAGVTIAVLANDTDANSDPLTAALVSGPANGTLVLNPNNTFTYTPNANFNGTDSFTYTANDGTANSNTATVTITVNPVNDAPVAVNDSFTVAEDGTLVAPAPGVLGNDTDVDGDTLTAALVTGPANGGLVFNADGSFTYTPNANFNGTDSFTYRANDGTANSGLATVNITVSPVNDAPVAVNDTYNVDINTPLTITAPGVLGNDTDVENDPLTAAIVAGPAHGSLTLNADGSFTYTPNNAFTGTDTFTYQANDGTANSGTATVTLTVTDIGQTFNGTAGNDTLTGTAGNDTLNGGAGDDILIATKGADTLDGGTNAEGGDTADFRNATSGVTVDLTAAMPIDLTANGLGPVTLANIENLTGSAFADTLTGDAANNTFLGGLGNDTIDGGGGTNTATFHGLETQYGVTGLTSVTGGPDGNDTLSNIQRLKFLSPSHVSDVDNNGAGDLVFEDDATGVVLTSVDGAAPNLVAVLGANMKAVGAGQFTADTDRMAGILVQDTTTGDLSVLTDLTGAAPLTPVTNGPALGANWQAITTGDFNGDAASDILLQNSVTGDAQILFLNVSAGEAIGQVDSFATVAAPAPGYTAISSGDFNNDGKSDILWQNTGSGATVVSLMSGSTVTNSGLLTPGANLKAIGTGDFNNDGNSDIMFRNLTDGSAQIWTMNGTTPTPTTFSVAAPTANSVLVGAQDIDGNGYSDLLWYDTTTGAVTASTFGAGGLLNAAVAQQSAPGFRLIASTGGG